MQISTILFNYKLNVNGLKIIALQIISYNKYSNSLKMVMPEKLRGTAYHT